jgi:putative DNA primase/helicase
MSDGTTATLQVRAYADPDLEALRVAITDAAVLQAAGRGRAVNRTAETPLSLFILADVVVPMPVKRIARWADVRLSPQQRMAARGIVTDSPTDAWRFYPDLFSSMEAAKKAFQRTSRGTFPYDSLFIGECPSAPLVEGRYRPSGSGPKNRRMWISRWRQRSARADLEAVLGPLAMFEMSGGGYGCKLTSEVLFPVSTAYAPIAGLWTVRRLGLTPIEVMELARGEILPLPVPADRTPPPMPDIGLAIRAPPPPPT